MKTFKQILEEGREAPLFHGTSLPRALMILEDDMIKAVVSDGADNRKAVSLTRNMNFARHWVSGSHSRDNAVVFQLNQQKLTHRYRIIPYNYWTAEHDSHVDIHSPFTRVQDSNQYGIHAPLRPNEFEEYVTKDIFPLERYLDKIIISKPLYEDLAASSSPTVQKFITKHPLLSIDGKIMVNK